MSHRRRSLPALVGLAAAFAASGAVAQARPARPPACPPQPLRWAEDCRKLAGETLAGLDRLRLRPLGDRGTVSLGAEARARVEAFDNPDFGLSGPDYVSVASRLLLYADVRSRAGPRLFVQLSAADETGREPGPRPFDTSGLDLAQGFIDLRGEVGGAEAALRIGRQELALSGNRLVGLRDGVTLRRAFDMVKLDVRANGAIATVFHGRPVLNGPGAFDDEADDTDRFSGATLDLPPFTDGGRLNLFVFGRDRSLGRFLETAGPDERQTYGFRYVRAAGPWDGAVQAALQRGETAGLKVRSWGASAELGRTLADAGRTRLAVQAGAASGDGRPNDGRLGAFDPLYPNLGVFSSAPLYFPSNQVNLGAIAQHNLGPVSVTLDSVLLSRFSERDAVYANPGRPLVLPRAGGRGSAVLIEGGILAPFGPRAEISGSIVHARALDALRGAGGRNATFAQIQLTGRF